jgi:hypothetical protein
LTLSVTVPGGGGVERRALRGDDLALHVDVANEFSAVHLRDANARSAHRLAGGQPARERRRGEAEHEHDGGGRLRQARASAAPASGAPSLRDRWRKCLGS